MEPNTVPEKSTYQECIGAMLCFLIIVLIMYGILTGVDTAGLVEIYLG